MANAKCTDEEFIAHWQQTGGYLQSFVDRFGFSNLRTVIQRRARIEAVKGITLASANPISSRNGMVKRSNSRRIDMTLDNGTILIGSDAHVWPGPLTTAQRGFIMLALRLKPTVIVMNGDVFDGAKISRHPAGIWDQESRPNVKQELEACQGFLSGVQSASPMSQRIWTWGNHDARFEYQLAAAAPQYVGVPGTALKDHFPEWSMCMAVFVNGDLVIKHRNANGIHAVYNNTVKSGRSMVTGHLHSLKVTPWTDYNGTRYGVDCGTLADPESKQFDYAEENSMNHRPGCVLLNIKDGKLMYPEIAQVWDDDHIQFRGELVAV
jgi:hypothetical protein